MIVIEKPKAIQENNNSFYISKNITKLVEPLFLENFEIQDFLGSGSESIVYKVLIKKIKINVAMKIFTTKNKEKSIININEIKITKKLKHNNIINYYFSTELKKNELYCIITDYAKYGNLKEFHDKLLDNNYLSESLLCFFTYQILNGLKYIHLRKICHFDLKPHNIVIDEYLNIKIIDFSVSLDYSNINTNQIQLPFRGTPFYMAPEVIKRKIINLKDINKVDLYSLGVILYYLAFKSYPFGLNKEDNDDYNKIYKKITKGLTINNKAHFYSSYFINFLNELLVKDIKKRINVNEALNNYWVKGAKILYDEKDKIYDNTNFFDYLINERFKTFNDHIKK